MDKTILTQYLDAEKLIEYTERQIRRLRAEKEVLLSDTVKGSNPYFPYEPMTFKVEGFGSAAYSDEQIRKLEKILEERKKIAADLRLEVEAWMNTLPTRIQMIVNLKFLNAYTWDEVSRKIGRNSTPDGLRMEYQRYLTRNE